MPAPMPAPAPAPAPAPDPELLAVQVSWLGDAGSSPAALYGSYREEKEGWVSLRLFSAASHPSRDTSLRATAAQAAALSPRGFTPAAGSGDGASATAVRGLMAEYLELQLEVAAACCKGQVSGCVELLQPLYCYEVPPPTLLTLGPNLQSKPLQPPTAPYSPLQPPTAPTAPTALQSLH